MIRLLIILLFSSKSFGQNPVAKWTVGSENLILRYEVWQSDDTLGKTSVKIAPIPKNGKLTYQYILPLKTTYYRIKAVGYIVSYFTAWKLALVSSNRVTITNAVKGNTYLSWTTTGEANVNYYLIERTYNSITTPVTQVKAKGNSNYSYRYTKSTKKYIYKITPIFNDNSQGQSLNFK